MAYSYALYDGDGATAVFPVNMPYIAQAHIKVLVDGVETPFEWLNTGAVRLEQAPATGSTVKIKRETPRDKSLVDFQNGTVFTESEIDLSTLQMLYIVQETYDAQTNILQTDERGHFDGKGNIISNIADPIAPQDVATVHWVETTPKTNIAEAIAAKKDAKTYRDETAKIRDETKDIQDNTASICIQNVAAAAAEADRAKNEADRARTEAEAALKNAGWSVAGENTCKILDCDNSQLPSGNYAISGETENSPFPNKTGTLLQLRGGANDSSESESYQIAHSTEANSPWLWRKNDGSSWSSWTKILDTNSGWGSTNQNAESGIVDLNSFDIPTGVHHIQTEMNTLNVPVSENGMLIVTGSIGASYSTQMYHTWWSNRLFYRSAAVEDNVKVWHPWQEVATGTLRKIGERTSSGTWTLTGVSPFKPIFFIARGGGHDMGRIWLSRTTGFLDNHGNSQSDRVYFGTEIEDNTEYSKSPTWTLIPAQSTVTLVVGFTGGMAMFAYQ